MEYEEAIFEESLMLEDIKMPKTKLDNSGFKCHKCHRQFTLSSNLTRHMRHNKICGISKGFECPNCHKVFSLNATMKDHFERCTAEDPYRFPCPYCPKQFTFKSSLNKHLRGRCRILKKKSRPSSQVYNCKFCAAEFYDIQICQKHEESGTCTTETESQSHVCPHCARSFTMKSSLSKHLKGRCKFKKIDTTTDRESKTEYVYQLSSNSNDAEDVEVYEAWFEADNVIEECKEEVPDIITDQVESYIEISNEATVETEMKFVYEINEEVSSGSQKTFEIQIDSSNM